MDTDMIFPLSLDFQGRHYDGTITPSIEKDPEGMPVYFRVEMGGKLFAYLCCEAKGWRDRDSDAADQPQELVDAIGNYIVDYYE